MKSPKTLQQLVTVMWSMILFTFALYCLLCSREPFSLAQRLGPKLPATTPEYFRFAVLAIRILVVPGSALSK
ncbi:hypothetical protein [Candidatus Uabimicrobium sp. HlEnr_7]|uniref:hypothetical protein n=1 Tax=Candidatus Uabimicrobium helgolandensis TaxID=3095367 RepID=UPI003558BFC9